MVSERPSSVINGPYARTFSGVSVKVLTRTSPLVPCAAITAPKRTRPVKQRLRRRCSAARCRLGAFLSLLLRLRLLRIVVLDGLDDPGIGQEAVHAFRCGRAFGKPGFRLLEVEAEPVGMVLGQQRIVVADALDEAAVTRAARFSDDDLEMGTLLGACASEPDLQ